MSIRTGGGGKALDTALRAASLRTEFSVGEVCNAPSARVSCEVLDADFSRFRHVVGSGRNSVDLDFTELEAVGSRPSGIVCCGRTEFGRDDADITAVLDAEIKGRRLAVRVFNVFEIADGAVDVIAVHLVLYAVIDWEVGRFVAAARSCDVGPRVEHDLVEIGVFSKVDLHPEVLI